MLGSLLRGGMGRREGALSPQVGIPGCPPIQSHDGLPMSSSRSKAKKEKLMTKVVWGQESRVKRKREVDSLFRKWRSLFCRVLQLLVSRSPPVWR